METATGIPKNSIANWNDEPHWTDYLQRVAAHLEVPIDTLFHLESLDNITPADRVKAALENMQIDDDSADAIIGIARIITNKFSKIT